MWQSASALATRTFSRAAAGPSPTRHDSHAASDGRPVVPMALAAVELANKCQ